MMIIEKDRDMWIFYKYNGSYNLTQYLTHYTEIEINTNYSEQEQQSIILNILQNLNISPSLVKGEFISVTCDDPRIITDSLALYFSQHKKIDDTILPLLPEFFIPLISVYLPKSARLVCREWQKVRDVYLPIKLRRCEMMKTLRISRCLDSCKIMRITPCDCESCKLDMLWCCDISSLQYLISQNILNYDFLINNFFVDTIVKNMRTDTLLRILKDTDFLSYVKNNNVQKHLLANLHNMNCEMCKRYTSFTGDRELQQCMRIIEQL